MKKMKHGGKARKTHKRMQDGGIASFGGMPASLDQRPGMYRPVGRPGRGGAMPSAISRGIIASGAQPMGLSGSIGGATGYQAGGGMTSDADSVPMGRGFRKGGAVKAKKNMRGGGLARKGVGMALAKGGLAKRAGGCAKRGVGRGKIV
jgi:hypothetical protein